MTYTLAGSVDGEAKDVARGLRSRDQEVLDRLIEQVQFKYRLEDVAERRRTRSLINHLQVNDAVRLL